jgi:ribbon-helix-helix CopG family protein
MLTPDLDAVLEQHAELEDQSASSIVRLALSRYVEQTPSVQLG